ncbi:MAG: hypothetical protein O7H39_20425 [Gammaproteobacteria bacterium]|nr:hypothetical protein [Gammaproteobacteria bacterium]
MDKLYRLVFRGEVADGQHPAVVQKRLKLALKLSDDKSAKLFTGKPVVFKKDADQRSAEHYQKLFKRAGAELRVLPAERRTATAPSDDTSMPAPNDAARTGAEEIAGAPPEEIAPPEPDETMGESLAESPAESLAESITESPIEIAMAASNADSTRVDEIPEIVPRAAEVIEPDSFDDEPSVAERNEIATTEPNEIAQSEPSETIAESPIELAMAASEKDSTRIEEAPATDPQTARQDVEGDVPDETGVVPPSEIAPSEPAGIQLSETPGIGSAEPDVLELCEPSGIAPAEPAEFELSEPSGIELVNGPEIMPAEAAGPDEISAAEPVENAPVASSEALIDETPEPVLQTEPELMDSNSSDGVPDALSGALSDAPSDALSDALSDAKADAKQPAAPNAAADEVTFDVAPVGSDVIPSDQRDHGGVAEAPDTSHLSLAEVGITLGPETRDVEPVVQDVEFALVDPDAILGEDDDEEEKDEEKDDDEKDKADPGIDVHAKPPGPDRIGLGPTAQNP